MSVIALDARKYFDFGIGTYIRHLVQEYSPANHIIASCSILHRQMRAQSPFRPDGRSVSFLMENIPLSEMLLLGRRVKADNVSVYHSPHYTLPLGLSSCSVVTIHDLIHLRFPQFFSPLQRMYSYVMIRHAIRNSQFVITDSQFTKLDILRTFRVKEEKIVPIHLGVSEIFKPIKDPGSIGQFRAKFSLQHQFILFVGNTKPHKGLQILIRAFASILSAFPDLDLVVVGGPFSRDKRLESMADHPEYAGKIRSLGSLSDNDLVLAYNAAEMLILPSLYEGFGLPPLEAMACETPVIVSNAASLPEVVGDAALLCEPGNPAVLADAITSIFRDSVLRKKMIGRGKEHAKKFSWHTTAKQTMQVYEKIGR